MSSSRGPRSKRRSQSGASDQQQQRDVPAQMADDLPRPAAHRRQARVPSRSRAPRPARSAARSRTAPSARPRVSPRRSRPRRRDSRRATRWCPARGCRTATSGGDQVPVDEEPVRAAKAVSTFSGAPTPSPTPSSRRRIRAPSSRVGESAGAHQPGADQEQHHGRRHDQEQLDPEQRRSARAAQRPGRASSPSTRSARGAAARPPEPASGAARATSSAVSPSDRRHVDPAERAHPGAHDPVAAPDQVRGQQRRDRVAHQHVELEDEQVVHAGPRRTGSRAQRVPAGPGQAAAHHRPVLHLDADPEQQGEQRQELAVGQRLQPGAAPGPRRRSRRRPTAARRAAGLRRRSRCCWRSVPRIATPRSTSRAAIRPGVRSAVDIGLLPVARRGDGRPHRTDGEPDQRHDAGLERPVPHRVDRPTAAPAAHPSRRPPRSAASPRPRCPSAAPPSPTRATRRRPARRRASACPPDGDRRRTGAPPNRPPT